MFICLIFSCIAYTLRPRGIRTRQSSMIRVSLTFTLHFIVNHYFDASMYVRPVVPDASMLYCFLNWLLYRMHFDWYYVRYSHRPLGPLHVRVSSMFIHSLHFIDVSTVTIINVPIAFVALLLASYTTSSFFYYSKLSQLRCLRLRLKPIAPFGKGRMCQVPSPTTI